MSSACGGSLRKGSWRSGTDQWSRYWRPWWRAGIANGCEKVRITYLGPSPNAAPYEAIAPVLAALEGMEPELVVPPAAKAALKAMRSSSD